MDTSKIAHQVGQAQGQAQEKGSQLMEKVGNAAQSTKETVQEMTPQAKENYQAGQAQGQAQEKASQLIEKAGSAAESTKETVQQTGQQVKATTLKAADAAKSATGMNK
ncbi:stress-induced protein KIN2-like isoform X4 [Lycium ferocissimum]|uniref:stress-induced protein KIN2-like isoform X4 n=1 Tax=Lycium ferocissimum TaxID=112874 RepID=UPI00281531C3|nr:stress-induced protein KIN2-like isoform X4 [Lycium ferocissimum]